MKEETELEFFKMWLKALDRIHPEVRGMINSVSITFTGKYIGIDKDGDVEVVEVSG